MKNNKKKILAVWLCIVIFATVFVVAVPSRVSASPTILYVGGNGPNNYTSIQSAVNDASSGDRIYVYAGTYYEHVTIEKSLILQGEDRENTIIDGGESDDVVHIAADSIDISGFTIQNGYRGIYLDSSLNSNIVNNIIRNNSEYGIYADSSVTTISDNEVYKNGEKGETNTLFSDDMEFNVGEWMSSGLWHQVGPGDVYQEFNSPTHSWWYGQDATGNYDTGIPNSGTLSMSSAVTISSEMTSAQLSFYCWYETEYTGISYDQRWCQIKADGAPWSDLEQLSGETMNSWHQHIIDISAYIGSTIQIGFRFDTIDSFLNNYRGWYIDDVEITESIPIVGGGIYLADCSNSNILNNTISNHSYGLYLDHSNDNIVYHNNFINNTNQAYDDSSDWNIETVDSDGSVGSYTSISLDSNAQPHISYYDAANDDLKYAKWDGSLWNIETVDSDGYVGSYTSIALDTNDCPHISYYDITNTDLKYAKWDGSLWNIETVDSDGYVGWDTSIALDSNAQPHISYYDVTNNSLKYAKWTGSTWNIETVDSDGYPGRHNSIALDVNDCPHISYYKTDNTDLKYAKWGGSAWNIETVDSDGCVGWDTSIALDSNTHPHISYYDATNDDLKYAKWDGSAWNIEIVDSDGHIGRATSIALEDNDCPHISYWDWGNHNLKYAKWTGSDWNVDTIDSSVYVSYTTSLALDANDCPHISYYDAANDDLKYAMFVEATNIWDNGYPLGGNYWSDYDGEDNYSGESQNISGSDGIGDTAYLIEVNNRDNYPLMTKWVPLKIYVSKEFIASEITTISQGVVSMINITNIGDVNITSMTITDEYVENMAPNESPELLITITSDEDEVYAIMLENLNITSTDDNITISFELPLEVVQVFWENGTLHFGEETYYLESVPKDWVVGVQYILHPVTELEIGIYYADATVTAYSETGTSTTETATGTLIVLEPIETTPYT